MFHLLEEVPAARTSLPVEKIRIEESHALLKNIPLQAAIIYLDKGGELLSTDALAEKVEYYALEGRKIFFLIGGHEGVSEEVFNRAALVFSVGRVTWPWKLMRGMVAEQLYRVGTLRNKTPYHRP